MILIPSLISNETFLKQYSYQFNTSGNHNVCIEIISPSNETNSTNNNSCKIVKVQKAIGIETVSFIETIKIAPNPVIDFLNVEVKLLNSSNLQYVVFNNLGQKVYSSKSKIKLFHQDKLDLSKISKGIYYLEIKTKKESLRRKIFIQ